MPLRSFMFCCVSFDGQPYDSMEEVISKVRGYLRHDSGAAQIIAIKGAVGMGKSTILRQLSQDELTRGLFDVVLFATVSTDNSAQRLQEVLIHQLGLSSLASREGDAAEKLSSALSNKRFLLLLDDVEEELDLASLGIPTSERRNMNGKVVIATRSSHACQALGADHIVELRPLNAHQSEALFWTHVGRDAVGDNSPIRGLGLMIVAQCRGLPLALIMVGNALSSKRRRALWEDAVKDLQHMLEESPEQARAVAEGMDPVLYSALNFAYKSLETDKLRRCLMYCSMFPHGRDINIKQLIEYWVGDGLLDVSEHVSLHAARIEGYRTVKTLLSSGFLQEGDRDDESSVKLHDSFRIMAQSQGFVVTDGENRFVAPTQITRDGRRAEAPWASLTVQGDQPVGLSELCHPRRLSSLLIISGGEEPGHTGGGPSAAASSLVIGDLLQLATGLKVLDLSGTCLEVLPPSIALLCGLQHLNLSYTNIKSLPTALGELKKLRQLIVTSTRHLSMIPSEAISSLGRLQLLNAYMSAYYWCGRDHRGKGASIQIMEDLCGLNELGLNLNDLSDLRTLIASPRFHECTRFLKLSWVELLTAPHLSMAFKMLRFLQELSLSSCQKLDEFTVEHDELSLLDVLTLDNLPLSAVAAAPPTTGALVKLRRLRITRCNSLKHLTWAGRLPSLVELYMVSCAGMVELLEDNADLQCAFPRLSSMHLGRLPLLRCVSGRRRLMLPSMERLKIEKCPQLTVLPFGPDTAPRLKHIHGEQEWWTQLTWDDQTVKQRLDALFLPEDGRMDKVPFEVEEWPARVEDVGGLVELLAAADADDTSISAVGPQYIKTVKEQPPDDNRGILARAIIPAGFATGKELKARLCSDAVLIDGGEKSSWLDEATGKRCYMVSVTGLWTARGNDPSYWRSVEHTKSRFTQVAQLISACWLDVQGKMKIQDLSPGTVYTASLVHKLSDDYGLEDPLTGWVTVGGLRSERAVCFHPSDELEPQRRPDWWMELRLGEFFVDGGADNQTVHFSLKEVERLNWKGGLVIQGIEVRPVGMESTDGRGPADDCEAERLLPADYEDILSRCVYLPNFSTALDLYNLLCDAILIDDGKKRFALERSTGKKCYMLSARDLSITWGDDQRYWIWESPHKKYSKDSRFTEVAKLLMVCWLEINGRVDTSELSPYTTYAAYLIFDFTDNSYGFDDSQDASVAVGATPLERRRVRLRPRKTAAPSSPIRRRDGWWMEVELGDFVADPGAGDEDVVKFGLQEVRRLNRKGGLIIEGIEIKPRRVISAARVLPKVKEIRSARSAARAAAIPIRPEVSGIRFFSDEPED